MGCYDDIEARRRRSCSGATTPPRCIPVLFSRMLETPPQGARHVRIVDITHAPHSDQSDFADDGADDAAAGSDLAIANGDRCGGSSPTARVDPRGLREAAHCVVQARRQGPRRDRLRLLRRAGRPLRLQGQGQRADRLREATSSWSTEYTPEKVEELSGVSRRRSWSGAGEACSATRNREASLSLLVHGHEPARARHVDEQPRSTTIHLLTGQDQASPARTPFSPDRPAERPAAPSREVGTLAPTRLPGGHASS